MPTSQEQRQQAASVQGRGGVGLRAGGAASTPARGGVARGAREVEEGGGEVNVGHGLGYHRAWRDAWAAVRVRVC